jgi:hypothetical protein
MSSFPLLLSSSVKEANPAHEVHRIGVRVLAGNRDLARKPQDKESSPPHAAPTMKRDANVR